MQAALLTHNFSNLPQHLEKEFHNIKPPPTSVVNIILKHLNFSLFKPGHIYKTNGYLLWFLCCFWSHGFFLPEWPFSPVFRGTVFSLLWMINLTYIALNKHHLLCDFICIFFMCSVVDYFPPNKNLWDSVFPPEQFEYEASPSVVTASEYSSYSHITTFDPEVNQTSRSQ